MADREYVRVKNARLKDVLKYAMYERTMLEDPNNIEAVCNICGATFELPIDVLAHIIDEHMESTLPDVDPREA